MVIRIMEDTCFKFAKDIRVSYYVGNKRTGDPITITTLYDVMFNNPGLEKININAEKGAGGSIQLYVQDRLGKTENSFTDGIIGIDIDKISKDDCKTIYDNFDLLIKDMYGLTCCYFSNSYYNPEKTTGGLHILIRTYKDELYEKEYRNFNANYAAVFAYIVYERLGIDIRPRKIDGHETGLDKHLKSIAHRLYLNYSTVKWNDLSAPMYFDEKLSDAVHDWMNEDYDNKIAWYDSNQDYKTTVFNFKELDLSTYNGGKINLGFNGRITLINALHQWGVADDKIIELILSIAGEEDWEGDKKEPGKLLRSVEQCVKSSHSQHPTAEHLERAKKILEKVGVSIDLLVEKVYQPLEYTIDPIFEEVFEESKDWLVYNHKVFKRGKNFFEFNLKAGSNGERGEFLGDYTEQLRDIILKHKAVYLVGDCMIGKTEFAKKMQLVLTLGFEGFWASVGDGCDLCEPYNSVADNKSKGKNKEEQQWANSSLRRVITQKIEDFDWNKRNIFIWNTVKELYNKYFKELGLKRNVLFFDECHKIITEEYRWETVFEMMSVLPNMYKHFVFMTGTPAFELDYLMEYFPDICIIKINKESEYKQIYDILYYEQISDEDRRNVLNESIAAGQLPLVYTNHNFEKWVGVANAISVEREEKGLPRLKILLYRRDNDENLVQVNESSSIKDYDVVIATKYCSVGVDFYKDDDRMRCSIIDYAGETDCTFQDIHQFTQRNRHQDTISKLLVRYNKKSDISRFLKLKSVDFYEAYCTTLANIHTYTVTGKKRKELKEELKEQDTNSFSFLWDTFEHSKFKKLISEEQDWFEDTRNVRLLASYYKYVKIFSNMRLIKHMLEKRGFIINEKQVEHIIGKIPSIVKREIYKFFVNNYDEISDIVSGLDKYDKKSYPIDINTGNVEHIKGNKIYTRNVGYMNVLINEFTDDIDWLAVLKEFDYIPKDIFGVFRRMKYIAKKITNKELDELNKLNKKNMTEEDFINFVDNLVNTHYKDISIAAHNPKMKDYYMKKIMGEVINDYKKILRFAMDNIEFIAKLKSFNDSSERLTAFQKMAITMEQKRNEGIKQKRSDAGKKKTKQITVKYIKNGEIKKFGSLQELADYFKVSLSVAKKFKIGEKTSLSSMIQVIDG